jgi:hypothetical protein
LTEYQLLSPQQPASAWAEAEPSGLDVPRGRSPADALSIVHANRYAQQAHIFQETHDGTENPPRREEKIPIAKDGENAERETVSE